MSLISICKVKKTQMIDDYSTEDMAQASPSMFDAYNGDVKSAINVVRKEADQADSDWMQEELEAVALYLEKEVL